MAATRLWKGNLPRCPDLNEQHLEISAITLLFLVSWMKLSLRLIKVAALCTETNNQRDELLLSICKLYSSDKKLFSLSLGLFVAFGARGPNWFVPERREMGLKGDKILPLESGVNCLPPEQNKMDSLDFPTSCFPWIPLIQNHRVCRATCLPGVKPLRCRY